MATISLTRIKEAFYSIRWRILIAYLLIISIAFSVVAVSLIQLVGDYLFKQRVRDDQRIAENLAEQMNEPLRDLDAEAMYAGALSFSQEYDSRVLILDPYGVVQVDADSVMNGTRLACQEVASVLAGEKSAYGFYDLGHGGSFVLRATLGTFTNVQAMTGLYAAPILDGDGLIGVLVYISQTQEIYESLRDMQERILLWLVLVAVSALLVSVFVGRMITRPVGALSEGISRMSRGDLSSRVTVQGKNEFAQLASAFNSMSERLEQLDKSRSQFVSNASHELKTPLSTMKILLESLIYQENPDPAMTKEFLSDINKEIDRLSGVVSDLLTLVSIDNGMKLNMTEVRLRDLLADQVKRLSPLARERGIELECVVCDPVETMGDAVKLQQVVYNVIDNAIKYTPRGGSVRTELSKTGKNAYIRVTDTGIGIPKADLPHIFERFYRVDKARSRETGGTGLGLSIVKQVMLLHGGDITASSEEGKGSTFIIELPIVLKKDAEV